MLSTPAFLSLIGLIACHCASASEAVVVIGKLKTIEPMSYVADECPDAGLCFRRWWKAVIDVKKAVQGQAISGRVTAAVAQHAPMTARYKKSIRYFVLEAIEDPEMRKKLRADYYLDEASPDLPYR